MSMHFGTSGIHTQTSRARRTKAATFSLAAAALLIGSSIAGASDYGKSEKKEAAAPEVKSASMETAAKATETEVGKKAPEFTLKDTDGREHKLSDYTKAGKVVVLEWFNPDCPFVKKHHVTFNTMASAQAELAAKNVVWLAINSGAPGKQGAGLERNKQAKAEYKISYPILLDEAGKVGRLYGAKTTPHMFVIAADGTLIYKGAIDSDKSPSKAGETVYVRTAVTQLLAGEKVATAQTESYGCSVKYGDPAAAKAY